jgi:hypothetical protein
MHTSTTTTEPIRMNNFTRTEFQHAFAINAQAMHGYQKRFIAFVTALGFKQAYEGAVAARNARFMAWMGERKADFVKAHGEHVQRDYCTGYYRILSDEAYTDFIISGEWIK